MSETAVNGVEPIIFLDDVHVTFRTRTGSILHPNLVHAVQGVTIKLMPGADERHRRRVRLRKVHHR